MYLFIWWYQVLVACGTWIFQLQHAGFQLLHAGFQLLHVGFQLLHVGFQWQHVGSSSWTKKQTQVPCTESSESQSPVHHRSPSSSEFFSLLNLCKERTEPFFTAKVSFEGLGTQFRWLSFILFSIFPSFISIYIYIYIYIIFLLWLCLILLTKVFTSCIRENVQMVSCSAALTPDYTPKKKSHNWTWWSLWTPATWQESEGNLWPMASEKLHKPILPQMNLRGDSSPDWRLDHSLIGTQLNPAYVLYPQKL